MPNTIGDGKTFNPSVQKLDANTPAYGPAFDAINQALVNNDSYLAAQITGLLQAAANSGVIDYSPPVSGFNNGTGAPNGQIQGNNTNGSNFNSAAINEALIAKFNTKINGILSLVQSLQAGGTPGLGNGAQLNTIVFDAPPASNVSPSLPGSARDDFAFLECYWDTTGKWQQRIRVVDGVDFTTFSEGMRRYGQGWASSGALVIAQGGNSAPVSATPSTGSQIYIFHQPNATDDATALTSLWADNGVYIAGNGTVSSQTTLNTLDGYSYAIPLFRVRRRNNAGYDPDLNPNGAIDYLSATLDTSLGSAWTPVNGQSYTVPTTTSVPSTFQIGKPLYRITTSTLYLGQITAVTANSVTFTYMNNSPGPFSMSNVQVFVGSDRPDGLFSNIIDGSDITDLRHQVSLTGFNEQVLLENSLDMLLRGQLNTKDTPRYGRDYIGLNLASSMADDANTLLKCDFNGVLTGTANGASVPVYGTPANIYFIDGVQGMAVAYNSSNFAYNISIGKTFTVEGFYKPTFVPDSNYHFMLSGLIVANGADTAGNRAFNLQYNNDSKNAVFTMYATSGAIAGSCKVVAPKTSGEWHYFKIAADGVGTLTAQIDEQTATSAYDASNQAVSAQIMMGNVSLDSIRVSSIVRSGNSLPNASYSFANGDRIIDGPNGDFFIWSDDLGGAAGLSGRTNPYGLSRVPNQIAARASYNGAEVKHYYGNGLTQGWAYCANNNPNPTGVIDFSMEQTYQTANEMPDGARTTFTFNKPAGMQGVYGQYNVSASLQCVKVGSSYVVATSVSIDTTTGMATVVLSSAPASGTLVQMTFEAGKKHIHLTPSTKGFVLHEWTDDSFSVNGTTYQTTKYNVFAINNVRTTPSGQTTSTIQPSGFTTAGLNAATTLAANAASGATSLTFTSGTNFFNGQNIRVSKGDGTWYTTTITTVSGNTITVPATTVALSQNAIIQGTAQVTFSSSPAAGNVDVVYESVITPALGDYIRVMYQHTPYQGYSSDVSSVNLLCMANDIRTTSRGTGKLPPHQYISSITANLPLPAGANDYDFKDDSVIFANISTKIGSPMDSAYFDNDLTFNGIKLRAFPISNSSVLGKTYGLSTTAAQRGVTSLLGGGNANNSIAVQSDDLPSAVPHLNFMGLIGYNTSTGELLLIVATMKRTDKGVAVSTHSSDGGAVDVFRLPGRPLIKGYGGVAA